MTDKTVIRKGETVNFTFDWSRVAKNVDTALSSATWESDTTSIALSSPTVSGNSSIITVTNANQSTGCATLTNTATMADGQVLVRKLILDMIDETCSPTVTNDYRRYY
jgi:hypothetical protein